MELTVRLIIFLWLSLPQFAFANLWQDLWYNQNQQAQHALQQGDAKQAATLFNDENWQGYSFYKHGDYQQAIAKLSALGDATATYNLGNAYAQTKQYQKAIAAYNQALKLDPNNKDAAFNKKIVEDLLKQSSKNDQQKNENSNQDSSSDTQNNSQQNQQTDDPQTQEQSTSSNQQQNPKPEDSSKNHPQDENNPSSPQQTKPDDASQQSAEQNQQTHNNEQPQDLSYQQLEQWLRQIPDDPAGLLQQKFIRDYQRQLSSGN